MIDNAEVIRFSDEIVRPDCESLRNIYWQLKALAVDWQNGIGALIPNDPAEVLVDGRLNVADLTGEDLHNFKNFVLSYISLMETGSNLNIIQKPCVRSAQVS